MPRPVLHLISQAHLDPVWLWPERDGIAEALTTLQSAVDRAAEFPEFKFTRSSAAIYRWAEQMDPRLFASIKELIVAGRWEVIGGWIEQPDCNLPSTESFLRQALYGKAYLQDRFGAAGDTRIGYVPDSFGHAAGLPQILQESGFDAYVFMRPQPENGITLPLLFQWQSPDGARVLGIRIPIQYSQSYAATPEELESIVRASAQKGFAPGFQNGAMWFGIGNHGGGPTREHIQHILKLQKDETLPEIRFSTVREFIAAVRAESAYAELPVIDHELQFVFRGCYAATGETKQQHRASENKLFTADALLVIRQPGRASARALDEDWWQLGFNQFHDILAGTCVFGSQEDIRTSFGSITHHARQSINQSAFAIARNVDTSGEPGSVLCAVNALPWARTATVQLDTFSAIHGRDEIVGLETPDRNRIPVQWMQSDANFGPWGLPWGRLTASLPLPAAGHRVFRVVTETSAEAFKNPFSGDDSVSTEQFIKTGEDTKVERLSVPAFATLKTPTGRNLLAAPPKLVIINDRSSTWGHSVESYDQVLAELDYDSVEQIESGKVLTVTRHRAHWDRSTFLVDVIEHHLSGDVELRVRFNWQQERQLLKLAFSTALKQAQSVSLNPGAIVTRPARGHEEPCHDWVALEGKIDGQLTTFAVGNDSTYSYSAQDAVLALTLARGVPHAEHPPFDYQDTTDLPFLDQGWQERRCWLHAGDGPCVAQGLSRRAKHWQIPAVAFFDSAHAGELPRELSVLQLDSPQVAVLALKAAEDGRGDIVRVQDQSGQSQTVRGRFQNQPFAFELAPWQIKTLRLSLQNSNFELEALDALESASTRR